MNERGFSNQFLIVLIMGFIMGALILIFYVVGIVGPQITAIGGTLGEAFDGISASTDDVNIQQANAASFQQVNPTIQNLEYVTYFFFILMFISFIIMCYFVRVYPFLAFIWIIIMIALVFVSLFLTVGYQQIIASDPVTYGSWEEVGFILSHLPHFVSAFGLFSGIILFVLATRDQEAEGQTL